MRKQSPESWVHLLPSEDGHIPVRQAVAAPDARSFQLRGENPRLRTKILASTLETAVSFYFPGGHLG